MILKRLRLENFLAHKNTEIVFPEKGIIAFIGENGAGKSSIIEGILYGIFGRTDRGNIAELIQWGRKQAKVEVDIKKGKDLYRIERIITLRGKKAVSTGTVYKYEKGRFLPYFQKNISKEIPKITGISQKTFLSSVLVKQGDIEGIIDLSPRERSKVFEDILDMSLYQIIAETTAQKRRNLQTALETLKNSLKNEKDLQQNLDQVQKQISEEESKKARLKEEISQIEKSLSTKNKKLEQLIKEKEKIIQNRSKLERSNEILKISEKNLKEKEEKLKKITKLEEKLKDFPDLEAEIKYIENILQKFSKIELITERILPVKEKIDLYHRYSEELEKLKDTADKYLQQEKKLKEIKEKIKEIEKLKGEKKALEKRSKEIKERSQEIINELSQILENLLKIKKSYLILKDNPLMIDQFLQNNANSINSLIEEKEKLKEKMGSLKTYGEEIKKKISGISKIEGKCPTCSRPLDQHTKQQLITDLNKELEERRKQYRELMEKEKEINSKLKLEKEAETLLKKFKDIFDRYTALRQEQSEIKSKLTALENQIEKLLPYLQEEKDIENFMKENKEKFHSFIEAEKYIKNNNIKELEAKLRSLTEEKNRYEKEIGKIKREDAEKQLENLKEKQKEYQRIAQIVSEKEDLIKEIENIHKDIENIKQIIKELKQKSLDETGITSKIEKLKKQIEEETKKLREISSKLINIESEIGKLLGTKEAILKDIEENEKLKEDITKLEEKISKYKKIENALGPQGIQKVIRENAMYELPKITNLLFSAFEFPFQQVRFADNFDISLLAPSIGKEDRYIPTSSLSGGQKVALGLALRLAIGRFLSGKTDFIILDEPTVHLDQTRRNELVNILINMKNKNVVNQLIVVTHDTEIEDAADVIYHVENGFVKPIS